MKKIRFDKAYLKTSIYALFVIVLSLICYKIINEPAQFLESVSNAVGNVSAILAPFTYAFCFAYLLNPGVMLVERKLIKKIKLKKKATSRTISIFIIYAILLISISFIVKFLVPEIIHNVNALSTTLPQINVGQRQFIADIFEGVQAFEFAGIDKILESIVEPLMQKLQDIPTILNTIVSSTFSFAGTLFNLVMGLIISMYMLQDKESTTRFLKKTLYALLKYETASSILTLLSQLHNSFHKFIVGKSLDSLIIGILCFIGMELLNINMSLLLSLIVGITNMIPYFGPFIGAVPAILLTLLSSPTQALVVALFILVLQQFDGNILGPLILGESTGLTPFLVILSIILGGALLGPLGMFLAVPVSSVIKILLGNFIENRYRSKYNTRNDLYEKK